MGLWPDDTQNSGPVGHRDRGAPQSTAATIAVEGGACVYALPFRVYTLMALCHPQVKPAAIGVHAALAVLALRSDSLLMVARAISFLRVYARPLPARSSLDPRSQGRESFRLCALYHAA